MCADIDEPIKKRKKENSCCQMGILLHTANTGIMWITPWTIKTLLGSLRLFPGTKHGYMIHACTSHTHVHVSPISQRSLSCSPYLY